MSIFFLVFNSSAVAACIVLSNPISHYWNHYLAIKTHWFVFTVNILQLKAHLPHQKHDLVVNSVILTHPELLQWSQWNGKTQCSTGVRFLSKDRKFWGTLLELMVSFLSSTASEGRVNYSRQSLVTSFIQAQTVLTFFHFPSSQSSCENGMLHGKTHRALAKDVEKLFAKVWPGNSLSHLKMSFLNRYSAVLKGMLQSRHLNFSLVPPV